MLIAQTREALNGALAGSSDIVFVPTMGNLHAGHLALVEAAKWAGSLVVVSIFVNPLQFGPTEDFDDYPRTFEADCDKLEEADVDVLFAPTDLYPEPQSFFVDPTAFEGFLETASRPGHLRGVATVLLKLFSLTRPKKAFFGKKDYQQLAMVKAMVRQLALPTEIVGVETIRDDDGLALSSRNGYLSTEERQEAPRLYRTLSTIARQVRSGNDDYDNLIRLATEEMEQHGWQVDYVAIRPQDSLQSEPTVDRKLVVLGAARIGKTRLIDNVEV